MQTFGAQGIKNKGIEIDVLVNNAGQGKYGLFADSDLERQLDIIQLNTRSSDKAGICKSYPQPEKGGECVALL